MAKVMMNIEGAGAAPTIDGIRKRFGLSEAEIDVSFGVVEVEPSVYTVLVEQDSAAKLSGDEQWKVEGPYSNARIAHFGPPESTREAH
ncbi:MAG TPA: hypothetical protein VK689_04060 [Armatimonadota bacterium]|nr:hypothetical protein [Armatimonadota bacterium]